MHLCQLLDTVGDGTGTNNATGNHAATSQQYKIAPGPGQVFAIERLLVTVRDTGSFDAEKYGNNITLANGITLKVFDGNDDVMCDYTAGVPITYNAGWRRICYDADVDSYGAGDEVLSARFTFSKLGHPLVLVGDAGHYLAVTLNDDFSGLNEHRFQAEGKY